METKIEHLLSTFKKDLSLAKEEDIAKVMEGLANIESEINYLSQKEETIKLFEQYKYELSKICIESGKLANQKFQNESSNYGDHQQQSQTIFKPLQNQLNIENMIQNQKKAISAENEENLARINEDKTIIESQINNLSDEEEKIKQLGSQKEENAKMCIESGKLANQKFQNESSNYGDHQQQSQTLFKPLQNQLNIENMIQNQKKAISAENEENLARINEDKTIIESQINNLSDEEEKIKQLGSQKEENAKMCIQSENFIDQKLKQENHQNQYFYDCYQNWQTMPYSIQSELNIENLLSTLKKSISVAKEDDLAKIKEELIMIIPEINNIQEQKDTKNKLQTKYQVFGKYDQTLIESSIPSNVAQQFNQDQEHTFIESDILSQLYQPSDNNQEISQSVNKQIQYQEQQTHVVASQDQIIYETETQDFLDSFEQQGEEKDSKKNANNFKNKQDNFIKEQQKQQLDVLLQENKKCYYLILGDTGVGKSSFIKKITENPNIQTSDGEESHTQQCQIFEKEDKNYIDTPGISDTETDNCEILLRIVKFIKNNKLILENLFILLIQSCEIKCLNTLREFSYTYFLYELFGDDLENQQVKILIEEYHNSKYLLNWSEIGFDCLEDSLKDKRNMISKNKDKASNYFEYIYTYHIRVLTHFDRNQIETLKIFDEHETEFLKVQVWSEFNQQDIFYSYNNYIKDQKNHLIKKIEQILSQELKNNQLEFQKGYQNILLIGQSQVGKSSMIEQLTNQKGFSGGDYSKTQVCSTYRVDYGNTIYRFIDTPGYKNTGLNDYYYDNFKIIADYLKRNNIQEFKLLFMINKGKNVRQTIFKELNEFFQFIAFVFNQDVSSLDRQYLKDILQIKEDIYTCKTLLKDKILQIFRFDNNYENIQFNDEFLKYTFFKSSYKTKNGELIQVSQEENNLQQKQLFEQINNIDSFTLDDKVTFRIKRSLSYNMISSTDQFMSQFNEIAKQYNEISNLSSQKNKIQQSNNEINQKKSQIIKNIKKYQFNVLLSVYRQVTGQVKQACFPDKVKNDTLRHFLPIQQVPILFEITDENPESILISKKQHYYSILIHQLSKFVKVDNQHHKKLLQNLAEIKLSQEICFQQVEHQKLIDKNYENKPKKNILKLEKLSTLLSLLNQNGTFTNKQFTYYSQAIQQILDSSNDIQVEKEVEMFLTPQSLGYDAYQLFQRFNNGKQASANNIWYKFIQVIKGFINEARVKNKKLDNLCNVLVSNKQIYLSQILICIQKIINQTQPNQSLKYYEVSQLLRKLYDFTNYSQTKDENIADEIIKSLEKDNFNQNQQILNQLFKPTDSQNQKDSITKFIIENFILSQITQNIRLLQNLKENNINHLERYIQQLQNIQYLIYTFYYNSDKFNMCDQVLSLMQSKLKSIQINQSKSESEQINNSQSEIEFDNNEKSILKKFLFELENFEKFYQDITYQEQVTFANRKSNIDNQFDILINIYSNLTYYKAELKLKQQLISEIYPDFRIMKLQIYENAQFRKNNIVFNCTDDQFTDLLYTLSMIQMYIENRYLSQVQESDQPNLTSLAQNEVLEIQLQFSIDLHDLAENSNKEEDFVSQVEIQLRIKLEELFQIEEEKNAQKQNQLRKTIEKKVKILNNSEMNYRVRSFYKSVQYLKKYFII